jgi:hypothetical protein
VEYPTARWQHFLQNFLKYQPKTFESKQKFSNWQRKRRLAQYERGFIVFNSLPHLNLIGL